MSAHGISLLNLSHCSPYLAQQYSSSTGIALVTNLCAKIPVEEAEADWRLRCLVGWGFWRPREMISSLEASEGEGGGGGGWGDGGVEGG